MDWGYVWYKKEETARALDTHLEKCQDCRARQEDTTGKVPDCSERVHLSNKYRALRHRLGVN